MAPAFTWQAMTQIVQSMLKCFGMDQPCSGLLLIRLKAWGYSLKSIAGTNTEYFVHVYLNASDT